MSTVVAGQIQRIIPRHFQIIDLAVAGHDNKAIALTTGTSISQVNLVLRSPIAQAEIARRRKESTEATTLGLDASAVRGKALSILEQASCAAATTLENELLAEKPADRLKAANSILDRAIGGGRDERRGSIINITSEQIALINLSIKESNDVLFKQPAHKAPAHSALVGSNDVQQDRGIDDQSANEVTANGTQLEPCDVYEDGGGCA